MKKLYTLLFLTAFGITPMVNAQTWSGFNNADGTDNNWSTLGNWVDDRIPLPGYTAQIYNNVTAVNVNTDSSIKNLSNATSRLTADGTITLSGANTITIDINDGTNDAPAIFNQSTEATTFTIDCGILISNTSGKLSQFTISGHADNILEFGSSSVLELSGGGNTYLIGNNIGEFHFNGTIISNDKTLIIGPGVTAKFGADSDLSSFTRFFALSASVNLTFEATNGKTFAASKLQTNGSGSTITVKEAAIFSPAEIRLGKTNNGGTPHTLDLYLEGNQSLANIRMNSTSSLNLHLDPSVTEVTFNSNNGTTWEAGSTINITGFKEGVLKFGTDNTALDGGLRLANIQIDGAAPSEALALNSTGNLIYASSLSVKNHDAFEFGIYPNPVNDRLTINTQEPLQKIEVVDMLGRTVLSEESVFDNVNTSSLNKGVYILKLTSEKGVSTKKIIKE